ncbi:MAG TPA: aspartyl/asparaginyl beta-hydroxylase domain-containing protein [Gammaproteobacteria bacterium]
MMESRSLVREAETLLQQGRKGDAQALLRQAAAAGNEAADALQLLSRLAFQDRSFQEAQDLLRQVLAIDPDRHICHFELGGIELEQGRFETALAHFETADALMPDHAVVMLHKALVLEKLDRAYDAAVTYKRCWANALDHGKQLSRLPLPLQRLMAHGRALIAGQLDELFNQALAEVRSTFGHKDLQRVERLIAVILGKAPPEKMPPLQRPGGLFFPGLPERKFFEREMFPWIEDVESQAALVRDEYLALAEDESFFRPYVNVDEKSEGVEHWKGVNKSLSWSSCHVYRHGKLREDVASRCPVTIATLDKAPLNRVVDHGPESMFSVLKPGTHIPPHHGTINGRLIVHLPLIVPENCGAIRVAGEVRTWEFGRCLIFDDSYAHEAWNHCAETRVVLIFDIWSPYLTDIEIAAYSRVIEVVDRLNVDAFGEAFFRE